MIRPVVLCGYETWSLTSREESRLRLFENRVLRRGENYIMRSLMICTAQPILFG
jgi:hypothetical protein